MSGVPVLEAKGICKYFGGLKAVEAVDAVETAETAADGQQSGGIAAGWTDSDISPDNQ